MVYRRSNKESVFATIDNTGTIVYDANGRIYQGSYHNRLDKSVLESTLKKNLKKVSEKKDVSVYLAIPSSLKEGLLEETDVSFKDLETIAKGTLRELEITDASVLSMPQAALFSAGISVNRPWGLSILWNLPKGLKIDDVTTRQSYVDIALMYDEVVKGYVTSYTANDSFDVSALLTNMFLRIPKKDSEIAVDANENIVISGNHPHLDRLRLLLEAKFDAEIYLSQNPETAVLEGLKKYAAKKEAQKPNPLTDLVSIARSII